MCKIPKAEAAAAIAKVAHIVEEKVRQSLEKSLSQGVRVFLRDGEGNYVEDMVELLNELFCKKDFEFSSEIRK